MKNTNFGPNGVEILNSWGPTPTFEVAFWEIVVDCLEQIHRLSASAASEEIHSFRSRIGSAPEGISPDLIYHDEPFYLACDLAGVHDSESKNKMMDQHRDLYDSILLKHDG